MLDVEIKDLGPLHVATVRHVGPFTELAPAFERICAWAGGQGLFESGASLLGIFHDDPKSTPAAELRSDAAITIPETMVQVPSDGIEVTDVQGGPYAVCIYTGPYEGLKSAYDWLHQEWFPTAPAAPADGPSYEVYLNDPAEVAPEELQTAIHIPVLRS